MLDQHAGQSQEDLLDLDEASYLDYGHEEDSRRSGGVMLPIIVWAVTISLTFALVKLGQPVIGVILLIAVALVHSFFNPRVTIYLLIASIPTEWIVGIIPQIVTLPKVIGVLALLVSIPRILRSMGRGRFDPIAKWLVLMLVWGILGWFWARYHQIVTFIYWQSRVLIWSMPLLLCINLTDRFSVRRALLFFILGCLITGVGYMLMGDVYSATESFVRTTVTSVVGAESAIDTMELNVIPRCLSLGIFACIFFIITSKAFPMKLVFVLVSIFFAIGVLLAKTRAVYLGLPMAMLFSILFLKGGGLNKRMLLLVVFGVLAGLAVLVISKLGFAGAGVQERFSSIFEEGARAGGRMDIWKAHINAFITTGFRGVGWNQMRYSPESSFKVAHNDVFSVAGELGLVGLIAFFGMHICLFKRIMKLGNLRRKIFCLMCWSFLILVGLTQTDYVRKFYGLTVGMILAMIRLDEAERQREDQYVLYDTATELS